MTNQRPVPITPVGEANNRFRAEVLQGRPGHHRILSTQGVQALSSPAIQAVLRQALLFPNDSFRESFDPYVDRDFIVVEHLGCRYWAKIDPYDLSMKSISPDPADDAVTVRVLTLMLPQEY